MLITCYFAAKVAVLKLDGNNDLCKVDEVGELCISSKTVGNGFWGLVGKTKQVFNVSFYYCIIAIIIMCPCFVFLLPLFPWALLSAIL